MRPILQVVLCKQLLNKRVVEPFKPYACFWAMAGINRIIILQHKEFLMDAVHQGVEIAGGKIGPSDGAIKKDITGNHKFLVVADQADAAIGMAWRVPYLEFSLANTDNIAISNKDLRFGNFIKAYVEYTAEFTGCFPEKLSGSMTRGLEVIR